MGRGSEPNHTDFELRPIGIIRSGFTAAAGTPIQPAYADGARGQIVVDAPYAAGLVDLDGFERVWLVYWMHAIRSFDLCVVPYRDSQERGVFATRAPSRPNPIGISAVRLLGRRENILEVCDIDVLDGTLLVDIKPYVPEFDSHPHSKAGWFDAPGVDRRVADNRFHGGRRADPPPELTARRAEFNVRTERYLSLGYDRFASARFIVEAAGRLEGPALDVGTGRGLTAMALARRGLEVVSVDPDVAEQELAALLVEEAGLAGRIHFMQGDAAGLSFAPGHFGCAALVDVLHHLHDPEPLLQSVGRMIRPGGKLLLADFDRAGFDLLARVHRENGAEHPVSGFTIEAAVTHFAAAGFRCRSRLAGHLHEVAVLVREA
jgi:tRNA (adenine37-N6)-methyltransferase